MPTLSIPRDSKLHEFIQQRLDGRFKLAKQEHDKKFDVWRKAEETTLGYIPESEADAVRRQKREAEGAMSYRTLQIPYSYGLLMSAHTYWTSVFFARSPIHQFAGRHGEAENKVQAMEALIAYQVEVGNFLAPYYLWLYDSGKYGHGVLGQYWDQQILHYGQLVEIQNPETGKVELYQATQEVPGYTGNCVYNISPWDFMHDPRVPLKKFQDGEFCIVRKRMGWNRIVERQAQRYYNENVQYLSHVVSDKSSTEGSSILKRPDFGLMLPEGDKNSNRPAGAILHEIYVELLPAEWGVGPTNYPQKWVFTVDEDCKLIIGATPLGMIHCKFPFDVAESEIEGVGAYARGMPEIMEPIQNVVDWLINTHFFNVRAALNNQFIVDPSKLVVKDVQNAGPGFIWRLRPEAYGTDISKMFAQVPVNDVTRAHMNDFQAMLGIGERTLGINDQIMGSLNTGSTRKTATEVRTTTTFGVNRLKTTTEYMSATAFSPHAQKLVQSSQQFYDSVGKLKRVGDLIWDAGQGFIDVSPDEIAGYFDYQNVDGTLPVDRQAQMALWKDVMASVRMLPPQVSMEYDWGRIFGWVAQLGGLKNIRQFRVQVVPDSVIEQQVAAGNVIPMQRTPPAPPAAPSGMTPGATGGTQAGANGMAPQT